MIRSFISSRTLGAVNVFCFVGVAGAATLDEIVVTGSRVEESVFEEPQAASVVRRREIVENIYRTTPEALAHTPGVTVQKTAHGQGSPFIRGLTGEQVLILVDGVRLNNSTFRYGPNQYLSTIDPAVIDHIEVVRGPSSALYGSDAMGGVINVVTRKRRDFSQEQDTDAEVNLIYGSADKEKTGRIAVEGNIVDYGYLANADYRDFDNLEGGGDIGEQLYTGYEEYHANLALSYRLDNDDRVDLTFQETKQINVPRTDKFINSQESQIFDPQEHTAMALHWDTRLSSALAQRIKGSVSFQRQKEVLYRQAFSSTTLRHLEDVTDTVGFNLQADKALAERHLLSYGLEYYADQVNSTRVDTTAGVSTAKPGSFPDDSKYYMAGVYLQDEYLLGDRSEVTLGIRYSDDRVKTNLTGFGTLDQSYSDVTGSIRWSGLIAAETRLFAGISQGFRAPNLNDIAVLQSTNQGTDVPSPDLESEKSINYELGMKVNKPRWQGTAVVFWSDYKGLIERRPGTYQGLSFIDDNNNGIQDAGEDNVSQKFNIGKANIWGTELDGSFVLTPEWTSYGNLAWARGENKTDNEPVSKIPPLRALIGARWQPEGRKYWLEPFVELVAKQDRLSSGDVSDPRIPDGGTPGYGTLNLHSGWDDGDQSLNVAFNNINDKAYKVHGSGVYGPGREIKLSYTRRF